MEPLLDTVVMDSTEMVSRKAVWGPPNNAEGSPSSSDSLCSMGEGLEEASGGSAL